MSMPGIRRRLRSLEATNNWVNISGLPPLTHDEITEIERRAHQGEEPTRLERARIERQSPIIDGELLMTCYRGRFHLKRYLGIDLAEV